MFASISWLLSVFVHQSLIIFNILKNSHTGGNMSKGRDSKKNVKKKPAKTAKEKKREKQEKKRGSTGTLGGGSD